MRTRIQRWIVLAFVASLAADAIAQPSPRGTPLTLQQIQQLLAIPAPDATIAKEVQSRGVDFALKETVIESLAKAGAGNATVAALHAIQPKGTLVITANEPSARVFMDGNLAGTTDGQGQ